MEIFRTTKRSNLCQITAYILTVIGSLLSLDNPNRFSRSSHQRCSIKKVVLKNFAIFTGKQLCFESLLTSSFIKKRLQHRYFPLKFVRLWRYLKSCKVEQVSMVKLPCTNYRANYVLLKNL